MNKMNWLRMESRIREQLKKANDTLDFSQIIVRIDEIVASETRRGNSLLQDKAIILSGSKAEYDSLSSEEWDKINETKCNLCGGEKSHKMSCTKSK